jgi:HAD superfamily hydrolase (TIGR01458 family)
MGFDIPEEYIFTPSIAAVAYMKETGKQQCYLLTTGDVEQDFNAIGKGGPGVKIDCVIIGDAGDTLTYRRLNTAFRYLVDGAELVALEKDRSWMAADGLSLSAGPFVQALEYATGKTAAVMGKPSKSFFELALRDIGLRPDQVAMIGDDIIADIAGAQSSGMKTILVRTGKCREETVNNASSYPTHILNSIAGIKDVL